VSIAAAGALAASAPTSNPAEWRVLGGNSDVWHYSPLNQINDKNVQKLGLAWMADIPTRDAPTGNPLVADDVVFQSGPLGRIYANDVRTGKLLWKFAPDVSYDGLLLTGMFATHFNRGVALLDDKVFVASGDCRLFAVDRRTGKEVWRAVACDRSKQLGITQAPRVGGGKVFIGNNCGDGGYERGYVDAYDAKTGHRLWRFYTMPGDPSKPFESKVMEMASKTWGTGYWDKTHGCVSAWDAMTYDERLNLLYIGTGSAAPWSPAGRAADAGDELFSNSIVAVNADTGEYVWHYQTVQHDGWDFDATMHIMIAELPIRGTKRRVVMTAPKNGFFYVLDAKSGRFLSANNYTPVNWASRINPDTGRPETLPEARYWEHPDRAVVVSPGPVGAHNWQAMAFNPTTGLVYIPALVIPTLIKSNPNALIGGTEFDVLYGSKGDRKWTARGELVAWDPATQTARWRIPRALAINGGLLSTAGNLVFQGTADGKLEACAADTGARLWSFDARGAIAAAPTTVQIDGEQVILVSAGNAGSSILGNYVARYSSLPQVRSPSRLLAFKLGATGTVPTTSAAVIPEPPLPRAPQDLAKKGGVFYEAEGCIDCHGSGVEGAGSSIADLRMASAETHEQLAAIVIGGLRRSKGMPNFPNITPEELKAIQAYILNEAWAGHDAQAAQASKQ